MDCFQVDYNDPSFRTKPRIATPATTSHQPNHQSLLDYDNVLSKKVLFCKLNCILCFYFQVNNVAFPWSAWIYSDSRKVNDLDSFTGVAWKSKFAK